MVRTSSGKLTSAAAACLLVLGSFHATAPPIAPLTGGGISSSGRVSGLNAALRAIADARVALAQSEGDTARDAILRTLHILRAVEADCATDAGLARLGTAVGEIIGRLDRIAADFGRADQAYLEHVETELVTALTTLAR